MLIFWDIDGTLMYCGADGTTALNKIFEELYDIENAFKKVGIGHAMDSVILEKIMTRFNIPDTELARIETKYIEILDDILEKDTNKRVLPGIRELIYFAERKGHVNSLLTSNMKAGAYAKLRSVGLDGHFVSGGFGDIKGEKWDIAEIAVAEIEILTSRKYKPEEIIMIGDSEYDIKTAKKQGYHMISVSTGWTDEKDLVNADPDVLFENFGDADAVMDVINRMNGSR